MKRFLINISIALNVVTALYLFGFALLLHYYEASTSELPATAVLFSILALFYVFFVVAEIVLLQLARANFFRRILPFFLMLPFATLCFTILLLLSIFVFNNLHIQ